MIQPKTAVWGILSPKVPTPQTLNPVQEYQEVVAMFHRTVAALVISKLHHYTNNNKHIDCDYDRCYSHC